MDWPLTAALTGIAIAAGAGCYGLVTFISSDAPPPTSTIAATAQLTPSSRLPAGYSPPAPSRQEFGPLRPFVLSDPDEPSDADKTGPGRNQKADPDVSPRRRPSAAKKEPPAKAGQYDVASLPPNSAGQTVEAKASAPAPAPERWRVVATANASYFNLGGHINRSGIVDSLASSHLRDAFKAHRNFARLPADIKAHILGAENIDLPRIAPYRVLLGINDRKLEEEQAVRFERVTNR